MAIRIKRTFTIAASVDRVGRALCSEDYSIEWANTREDVQSASHAVIRGTLEAQREYEVRYVEYVRTTTGKIDRDRTRHAVTHAVWDAGARSLRWTYTAEGNKHFHMQGVYQLTDGGDETVVDYQVTIEVRLPLIGGKITKLVAKGHERNLPRLEALLAEHAARSPSAQADVTERRGE